MITPQKPRDDVKHVIFVVHGIRDVGYWTNKIARRVQMIADTAAPPQVYPTETATEGYFAMFPFLLPARRRGKVEWLMDGTPWRNSLLTVCLFQIPKRLSHLNRIV
jgi:hypothetical protein